MTGLSTLIVLLGVAVSTAYGEDATDCSPTAGRSLLQHETLLPHQGRGRHAAYKHPAWLDQCKSIYLDVGSNIGVQVKKLYYPERFPGALILPSFERIFGSAEERRKPGNESGLCALGFEPSPLNRDKLDEIEEDYQKRGYFVHFYRIAAAASDGVAEFDLDDSDRLGELVHHWGAKLALPQDVGEQEGESARAKRVKVTTVDFSRFLHELTGHGGKIPFMKMDIEGAEWETLAFMLKKKQLCDDFIHEAFIETHDTGSVEHWHGRRTFETLMERLKKQECGRGMTAMSFVDDETYYDGEHLDARHILGDLSKLRRQHDQKKQQ